MAKGQKASNAVKSALFVEAYIANGGNGTKAAIAAGYSASGAHVQASRMLRKPGMAREIDERRARHIADAEGATAKVLRELWFIVHTDPRRFFRADGTLKAVSELDEGCAASIAAIDVDEIIGPDGSVRGHTKKLKFWDKNSAIQKAMMHLGLLVERKEVRVVPAEDLAPWDEMSARIRAARDITPAVAVDDVRRAPITYSP